MTEEIGAESGWADSSLHATDEVELHLLLPAGQFSTLASAALRSELTVGELLRRTIGEFLPASGSAGIAGEVAFRTITQERFRTLLPARPDRRRQTMSAARPQK